MKRKKDLYRRVRRVDAKIDRFRMKGETARQFRRRTLRRVLGAAQGC